MKKEFLLASFFTAGLLYSQVGVNTFTPASTFDITAKNTTGTSTNVDGILIPQVDRERAQSMTNIPTSTLIYVNNTSTGTQAGNAANIDVAGYYYYNGTAWVKMHNPLNTTAVTNIYTADGSLTGNRVVTQGANTLAFTGSTVNAFSVAGSTMSVDASNSRLGIGTTSPAAKLDMVGTTFGIKNASGTGSWDNLWFNVTGAVPSINASGAESGLQFNVGANTTGTYGDGQTLATVATMLPDGNMGIGTTNPTAKLHIFRNPSTELSKSALRIENTNDMPNMGDTPTTTVYTTLLIDKNTGNVVKGDPNVNEAKVLHNFINLNSSNIGTGYVIDSQFTDNYTLWVSQPRGGTLCDIVLPDPNNSERRSLNIVAAGGAVNVCGRSMSVSSSSTITSIPNGRRVIIQATSSLGGLWIVSMKDF